MTTTKPVKKARAPKKANPDDVRPETLAQFSRQVDEHLNTHANFAGLVMDLAVTRERIKALTKARAALFDMIKERRDQGLRAVPGTDLEIRSTAASVPVAVRKVTSAAVKKADPALWERAHAIKPFVQVQPPATIRMALPEQRVPELSAAVDDATLVLTYKEHPAWKLLADLKADEADVIEKLDKLGAEAGWDGLPITFADGWTAGLRRRQFDAERLAAIAPERFAALSVPGVEQRAGRTYVGRVGHEGDLGADEGADAGGD